MTHRYFIAFVPPESVQLTLKDLYEDISGKALPVEHLHCSLVFPFFLNEGISEEELLTRLREFQFGALTVWFDDLAVFETNNGGILSLTMKPTAELYDLHKSLVELCNGMIVTDTSPYPDGIEPDYLPHVSLDYHWETPGVIGGSQIRAVTESLRFDVGALQLFKETDRQWDVILEIPARSETSQTFTPDGDAL